MQYIKGRKKPWKVQMKGRDGKQVVAHFATKEDAAALEAKVIRERSLVDADLDLPAVDITLTEAVARYLLHLEEDTELVGGTINTNYKRLKLYWVGKDQYGRFGDKLLSEISQGMIEDHLKWLRSKDGPGISRATANRAKSALSAVFKWAMRQKQRYALRNPCRDIVNFTEKNKTRETEAWQDREHVAKYIEAARRKGPIQALFATIQLFGGLRACELLGLKNKDIDERAGAIHVNWIVDNADGGKLRQRKRDDRKGGTYSTLLLPVTIEAIRQHRKFSPYNKPDDWLFHDENGQRLPYRTVANWTAQFIKAAGVPRITPHGMRATFISLAEEAGFTREDIQLCAGHRDARTTQRYVKRGRGHLVEKAEKLGFGGTG